MSGPVQLKDRKIAIVGAVVAVVGGALIASHFKGILPDKNILYAGGLLLVLGVSVAVYFFKKIPNDAPIDYHITWNSPGECDACGGASGTRVTTGVVDILPKNGGAELPSEYTYDGSNVTKVESCVGVNPCPEVWQFQSLKVDNKDAAVNACSTYGATLATDAQLTSAQLANASWCEFGWIADSDKVELPNTYASTGCGPMGQVNRQPPETGKSYPATCYGPKPAAPIAKYFNSDLSSTDPNRKYSQYN